MRFPINSTGKSGGVRICYVDFVVDDVIYLITVCPKSAKDNLSQAERSNIKKVIESLKENLKEELYD